MVTIYRRYKYGAPLFQDSSLYQLQKADLRDANLQKADLRGLNLSGANLSGVNLTEVDAEGASFSGANLTEVDAAGASFSGANLSGAILEKSILNRANFAGADLTGASFFQSSLWGAFFTGAKLPNFQIPQDEELIVWKKLQGQRIAKLRIPKHVPRTACLINNKCRAESADVLEIRAPSGKFVSYGLSWYDGTTYVVGKNIESQNSLGQSMFDSDFRIDCAHGIHFFMTREEAKDWDI